MEMNAARVELETQEYRILGSLTIASVRRVSDALNDGDRCFLALSDVTRWSKVDGMQTHHPFMAVARHHVVCAIEHGPAAVLGDRGNVVAERA